MEGNPLAYFAIVVRKQAEVPMDLLERVGLIG